MLNPRGPSRLPRLSMVSRVLETERSRSPRAFVTGTYPNIDAIGLASPTNGARSLTKHGSRRFQFDAPSLLTRDDVAASPRAVPMLTEEQDIVDERGCDRSAHVPVSGDGGVPNADRGQYPEPLDAYRQDEKKQDRHVGKDGREREKERRIEPRIRRGTGEDRRRDRAQRAREIVDVELERPPLVFEARPHPPREIEIDQDPEWPGRGRDEKKGDQPPHLSVANRPHVEHEAPDEGGPERRQHPNHRHTTDDVHDKIRDCVAPEPALEAGEQAFHSGEPGSMHVSVGPSRADFVRRFGAGAAIH